MVNLNEQYQFINDQCIYLIKCGNTPSSNVIDNCSTQKQEEIITFSNSFDEAKNIASSILSEGVEDLKKKYPSALVSTSGSFENFNVDVSTTTRGWFGPVIKHEFSVLIEKVVGVARNQ